MIAVLGATGQLGTAFMRLLGGQATPVARNELDLSQIDSIPGWVQRHRPDVIINCAAYTAVDAAEEDEETARLTNSVAVGALATAAGRIESKLVTFSTDYVFDGTKSAPYVESDATNPLSAYGRTKLVGEELALASNPDSLVVRTSWVLSGTHKNFATTMLGLIRQGVVHVVDDQRGHPTIASDLAASVMRCIDRRVSGILHLANRGETTWFGLATEIAGLAGLDPASVKPTTTDASKRPAPRPANSVLDSERLPALGIPLLPHYRGSLPDVVRDLINHGY